MIGKVSKSTQVSKARQYKSPYSYGIVKWGKTGLKT